ncbi:MAG: iron complex outermembrane receptor protein [Paraglaciecola sp.]|jgi:iron complex outermembrane receptor protein
MIKKTTRALNSRLSLISTFTRVILHSCTFFCGLTTASAMAQASQAQQNEDFQTEIISVIGKIKSGQYRDDFADSATKTLTSNLAIPQPVDVINQTLIQSQSALDLSQVFRNSASVNAVDPLGHTNIRGFRLNENSGGILKNGLRDVSQGFAFQPLANIEKVEIIKGASSALYGRGEPGGLINLITKKPQKQAFFNSRFTLGSNDFYQVNIDANGSPAMDGDLLYRFNMQISDEQSFRDEVKRQRQFFAPTVSYQISELQKITVEAEVNKFEQTRDFGIARLNGQLDAMPDSAFINAPAPVETTIVTFQLSHQWFIGDRWLLNSKFRVGQDETDDTLFNPLPEAFQQSLNSAQLWLDQTPRVYRTNTTAKDDKDEWNLDVNLAGELRFGDIEHSLLMGINLNRREHDRISYLHLNQALYRGLSMASPALSIYALTSQVNPFAPQDLTAINLPTVLALNPQLQARVEMTDKVQLGDGDTQIKSLGFYLQDQIRFNQQWQLVLSARFDRFDYQQNQTSLNTGVAFSGQLYNPDGSLNPNAMITTAQDESDTALSPRIGLIYSPANNVSLYLSRAEQFDIQMGVDANGRPYDPQQSSAVETGVKWEVNDQLSLNMAWFDIEKTNLLTLDTNNPLFSRQLGEVRSKGFELSALGRLSDHWVLSANYANFDAKITKDPAQSDNIGRRERGTADSSGNVWLQYQIDALSFAFGANYVGARPGDDTNSFELPSYTLIDAAVTYQFSQTVKVRLQVDNLTDKRWYQGAFHSYSIYPGHGTVGKLSVDIAL